MQLSARPDAELRELGTAIEAEAAASAREDSQLRTLWLTMNDALDDRQRATVLRRLADQLERVRDGAAPAREGGTGHEGGRGGPGGGRGRGGNGAGFPGAAGAGSQGGAGGSIGF